MNEMQDMINIKELELQIRSIQETSSKEDELRNLVVQHAVEKISRLERLIKTIVFFQGIGSVATAVIVSIIIGLYK